MTRAEKTAVIDELKQKLEDNPYFYIADASTMTVEQVNQFRGLCFEKGIEMRVVKNTLAQKAMEAAPEDKNYEALFDVLKGPTALLFTEVANAPARVIKDFRKNAEKPVLKAAYIESAIYHGEETLDALSQLKSKEELLGDVILLLQSPAKNLISALKSGGSTISGLLKALEERGGGEE
jgi:large subunit ribosomal protein L10